MEPNRGIDATVGLLKLASFWKSANTSFEAADGGIAWQVETRKDL